MPFVISALRRHSGRALPQICAVASILMLSAPGGLQLLYGHPVIDHLLPQPGARANLVVNSPAVEQAIRTQSAPTRAVGLGFLMFQGTQALYGLEGIGGPDAVQVKAYEDLLDAGGIDHAGWGWLTVVTPETLDRLSPLLDLLNVGMVVTSKGQSAPGLVRSENNLDPRIDIALRPSAWPRAFFVDGVRTYGTPAELIQARTRRADSPGRCQRRRSFFSTPDLRFATAPPNRECGHGLPTRHEPDNVHDQILWSWRSRPH